MQYKRILTIQDISCLGQCSMTVAMPILSGCGHETCILPTAVLSTHTGGFGRPAVVHLDCQLEAIRRHWVENGITFDAVLVGYLGSAAAVEAAGTILDTMLAPGGLAIVDPAMGDNGRLYSGFDEAYVRAVADLCQKADILLPNLTEAALLTGRPYRESPGEDMLSQMMEELAADTVLLTGISRQPGLTGFALRQGGQVRFYDHEKVGGSCHGTGDIFAAVFTGQLMQGRPAFDSAVSAADFVAKAIKLTREAPAHWYGVKFEPLLGELGLEVQAHDH